MSLITSLSPAFFNFTIIIPFHYVESVIVLLNVFELATRPNDRLNLGVSEMEEQTTNSVTNDFLIHCVCKLELHFIMYLK